MKLSYSVKLEANQGKVEKLDSLLLEWSKLLNDRITVFWKLKPIELKSAHPPKEWRHGSKLIAVAARKAWGMVKTARKLKHNKPTFKGKTIDLSPDQINTNLSPATTIYDGWLEIATLEWRSRAVVPFKKYSILNSAIQRGSLCKSVTIVRRAKAWFAILTFETPEASHNTIKRVGIDVGYSIAATTSTGKFYGQELEPLQRRTKWRSYGSINRKPYRQGVNRVVKEIIRDNPQTDFQVEQLNFKGKRKRSPQFRTRLSRFAYMHLTKRLEIVGKLKGFQVSYVNPAYTSQTCPRCSVQDSRSRNGKHFNCVACGYENHADVVGALNINGGEAVVNYAGSAHPDPSRVPAARVSRECMSPSDKEKST
jgi:IS605 OrfB family transposase